MPPINKGYIFDCYKMPGWQLTSVYPQSILCLVAQLYVRPFGDPMDWSPPGSSVHEILQARILEWVAIPFSSAFSRPKEWTWVSCTAGRFFTVWASRETHGAYECRFYSGCGFWKQLCNYIKFCQSRWRHDPLLSACAPSKGLWFPVFLPVYKGTGIPHL